ncbi:Type I inositol polyphosphate 5-phosphatase 4 [Castilleja foliolosa]|uniref:Type I inositol polyphosphate 5-phosphatase 4 n=1 Tax=Castilleja foliolosa TaxID=1961234 RepID=A0ABD3DVH5_9LAMI
MRDVDSKKSKFSGPKTLVKKWLNIKNKTEDFHADDIISEATANEKSSRRTSDHFRRSKFDFDASQITDVHNYKVFVATWNVAGKSPPSYLNLDEWLHTSPPADMYVLGFQEIVPLNAGNVLGTEDNGPARKWLALIRKALNSLPVNSASCRSRTPSPVPDLIVELEDDFEGSNNRGKKSSSFFHRRSFHSLSRSMRMTENDVSTPPPRLDRRFSSCGRTMYEQNRQLEGQSRYCLVASKQMVGIFLTVWIKRDLRDNVRNLKVSCVGRGLMGYLGNKGSISISMSLHQTSFCFVCSHLTSGEKDGDELRRNSDVMEILRKTRFPHVHGMDDDNSPQMILDHDRVIWLGDLNYRISLSYDYAKALVEMHNWRALLENDQLRIEQKHGRVFTGWNEGRIFFPPTYKYSNNSDRYAGEDIHPKGKRRTPAWCDRILWYGRGLRQLSYVRGESRFSDHRPVYGIFSAEVEFINRIRSKKSMSSRVEVEELLLYVHGYAHPDFF